MALTIKQIKEILSEAGIPSENMDTAAKKILDGHTTSLDYLREEIATYKNAADKLPEVQKELDDLKAIAAGNDSYKAKFEAAQKELDDLKAAETAKVRHEAIENGVKKILDELGVQEAAARLAIKGLNFDDIKLNKDNTLADVEGLKTAFKSELKDFIGKPTVTGANTATPPTNTGGSKFAEMSLMDKMKYANEHPNDIEVNNWLKNPTGSNEGGNS